MSEDRTPTHCPHCGFDGAFGSLGRKYRTTTLTDDEGTIDYLQQWFHYHCPECDNITAMLEMESPVEE